MVRSDRIEFADTLRGIAALSVVFAHYGLGFWTPGPTTGAIANVPPVPADVMPAISHWFLYTPLTFSFAAFGVGLFFLISGFVIPISLDRVDTRDFIRGRVWRIFPTYAAGFSFTVIALIVASDFYGKPYPYSITQTLIHSVPGLRAVMHSPFIDYVVWTLEVEIMFYVLCASMAPLIRRGSLWVIVPPALLVALSFSGAVPLTDAVTYTIDVNFMFVGAIISFHSAGKINTRRAIGAGSFVAALSLTCVYSREDSIVAASYAIALAVFLGAYLARSKFPNFMLLRGLAAISYPLYVVHGIMGYVLMRIMLDYGISPTAAALIATVWAFCVATLIHFLVEEPSRKYGKKPRPVIPGEATQAAKLL